MANISSVKVGSTTYNIKDANELVISKTGSGADGIVTIYSLKNIGPIMQTGYGTNVLGAGGSNNLTVNLGAQFNNNRYITSLIVNEHTRDSAVTYIEKFFMHVYGQTTSSFKVHCYNSQNESVGIGYSWVAVAARFTSKSNVGGTFSGTEWYN